MVANGTLNPDYTPNETTAARLGWTLRDPNSEPIDDRWWLPHEERMRLLAEAEGKARAGGSASAQATNQR